LPRQPDIDIAVPVARLAGAKLMNFRVIEGGGERRNPGQEFAEEKLVVALREVTANLLRIVRGAGKSYELIRHFSEVIRAVSGFKDAAGHWPSAMMLSSALKLDDEVSEIYERHRSGQISQESIDRWKRDGTFERMYAERVIHRGVLQIIASKLLEQKVQVSAGESEMHQGIRDVIEAREKRRKIWDERVATPAPKKRGRKPAPRRRVQKPPPPPDAK
jgi:hypothetical protein